MKANRLILIALALAVLVSCQGKVKRYRLNVVKATLDALSQLRSAEEIAALRA